MDLSTGKLSDEPLPAETVLRDYLGGVGLGVKLLYEEVPPSVGPLDPANRLVFMTGPLAGTPGPGSSNGTLVSVNAETGFTVGSAHTHGLFAAYVKFAGYDGIIFQGASPKPAYLWLHDGRAELRDASALWGKDTHQTEDLIKQVVAEPRASVAAIGPAGENLIPGACVENDYYHTAASGGMGAVMGSKRLKAIAAYGRGGVPLANAKVMASVCAEWRGRLAPSRVPAGVTMFWRSFGENSIMATKNFLSPAVGVRIGNNFAEACKTYKITQKPCFGCPAGCSYKVVVTNGPRQGFVGTMGGGGENLEGAAAKVAVDEPGSVLWLADRYDRLGLGTSTIGCAISLAFECYERGLLTREETGGLELRWGDAAAAKLLDMVVAREGIGKVLANGPKEAARQIGGDAPKYAVHVKGAGFNLHDWRGYWQSLLGQIVASAGPRWEGTSADALGPEPDAGYPKPLPPFNREGTPEAVRRTQVKKLFEDCLGVCRFTAGRLPGVMALESQAIAAATGWEPYSAEEMFAIGERIANLERLFNMSRGLTAAHDLDVSPRVLETPADGKAQGKTLAPYLRDMVREYYRLMGWEEDTGRPSPQVLARLGLGA